MFRIRELLVSFQQEEHIWIKHQVRREEVEELLDGDIYAVRGREEGYAVYGQTVAGRYLVAFLYPRGGGAYRLSTARDMTQTERRQYQRRRGR